MAIKVRCTNILRYDKDAKKYIKCEHEFAVGEDLADATIDCPQCGNEVQVARLDLDRTDLGLLVEEEAVTFSDPAPAPSGPHETSLKPDILLDETPILDGASPAADDDDIIGAFLSSEKQPTSAAPAESSDDRLDDLLADDPSTNDSATVVDLPGGDLANNSLPDSSPADDGLFATDLAPVNDSASSHDPFALAPPPNAAAGNTAASAPVSGTMLHMGIYCPKCGAAVADAKSMCARCGFHPALNRQLDNREVVDDDAESEPTGFQLWLRNHLEEGESTKSILIGVAVLGGLLLILMIGAMCAIFGASMIVFAVAVVIAVALIAVAAAYAKNAWNVVLFAARLIGWRSFASRLRKPRVLDLRKEKATDDSLLEEKELAECVVLDLQGTDVSDAGLVYLTGFRQLRFVVLRKTNATAAGVKKLQQSMPRLWIWH